MLPELDNVELYAALADLTDLERETVWDYYWNGRKADEIAADRGCSVRAVGAVLYKARRKLAAALS